MQNKQFQYAEQHFQSSLLRGIAQYKQQKYSQALESFSPLKTPEALYNYANTLVQLARYQEALLSYQEVLKQRPDFKPARHNYALLKKSLERLAHKTTTQTQAHKPEPKQKKKTSPKKAKLKPQVPQMAEELLDGPNKSDLKQPQDKRRLGLEAIGSKSGGATLIEDEGGEKGKEGASIGQGLSRGKQALRKQDQIARKAQAKASSSQAHEAKKIVENKTLAQMQATKTAAAQETNKAHAKKSAKQQASDSNSIGKAGKKSQQSRQLGEKKSTAKGGSGANNQLSTREEKEQKQFLQHWLKGIEDNPAKLLQEIFKREYQNRLKSRLHADTLANDELVSPEQELRPW